MPKSSDKPNIFLTSAEMWNIINIIESQLDLDAALCGNFLRAPQRKRLQKLHSKINKTRSDKGTWT